MDLFCIYSRDQLGCMGPQAQGPPRLGYPRATGGGLSARTAPLHQMQEVVLKAENLSELASHVLSTQGEICKDSRNQKPQGDSRSHPSART